MVKKTIEISADVKNAKSAVKELDGLLKNTSKAPRSFKLFDKTEVKSLQDWASKKLPQVKTELSKLRENMKSMSDIDMFMKSKKTVIELEQTIKRLEKLGKGDVGGGESKGIGSILKGSLGKLAGPAALLGIGAYGVGKAYQGYNQRSGEADSRLGLRGSLGSEGYDSFFKSGGPYSGRKYGYDVNETLNQANILSRTVGNVNNLQQLQRSSRAYGLDTNTTAQQMGMLRKVGGQQNVEKNFATLIGTAVSSNLDQGLLGEYLENTSRFVEQMATEGTPDVKEVMRVMSGMVRQGGILEDSGRTSRNLTGLDQSIKGSSGARFGFFAQSMERMLGKGAGGSDVLMALNEGMFGTDTSRLKNLSSKEKKGFGKGLGFQQKAQGITSTFEDLTQGADVNTKALVASSITGIKGAKEALNFMNALKSGNFSEKQMREMEKEAKMSSEEKMLNDINKTLDMGFKNIDAKEKEILSKLGESVAPGINSIRDTLLSVNESSLMPILGGVSSLVDKFVGKEGIIDKGADFVANLFSGGQGWKADRVNKEKGKFDLLTSLEGSNSNVPLQRSLRSLGNVDSEMGGADINKIKQGMGTATAEQKANIEYQAWNKVMMQTRDIARARKEGKPLSNEQDMMSTIRNTSGLLPSGIAPKKLRESYADPELMPHIQQVAKEVLPGRERDLTRSYSDTSSADTSSAMLKLMESMEKLRDTMSGNTKALRDKNGNIPSAGFYKYSAQGGTVWRR